MTVTVIAHAARSGIAALDVVTAALDADPRSRARSDGDARALDRSDGDARAAVRVQAPRRCGVLGEFLV